MEDDAVIGQLYKALRALDAEKQQLLGLLAGIKSGELPLDRITIRPDGGVHIRSDQPAPIELHAVEDADEA